MVYANCAPMGATPISRSSSPAIARYNRTPDYLINMLKWALILGIVALIAGALGFTGIAGAAAGIAKFLFFLFLAIVAVLLLLGFFAGKKMTGG
jgi:uncharacterized membrane protein YtjA (UPF0391 family)